MSVFQRLYNVAYGRVRLWQKGEPPEAEELSAAPRPRPPPAAEPATEPEPAPETREPARPRERRL